MTIPTRLGRCLLAAGLVKTIHTAACASSYTVTTLASFNGANGESPGGNAYLTADAGGNLYGMTEYGGANGQGTVFKLAAGSNTITTLVSFNGTNGAFPVAGLISDAGGNLYGTTQDGGPFNYGTVFKLAAESGTVSTLAPFNGIDGNGPVCNLVADASGNLFGTTLCGGTSDLGTVFKVAAGSGMVTILASFDGTNGASPWAGLIADSGGNLYGTTLEGGPFNQGTVFKLAAGSATIATLASFDGANGATPVAGLIADASGNLFGTTQYGGANGRGTVFELVAGSNAITTLASFDGANGNGPRAGLLADAGGNLYGTTAFGGANGRGTVFELAAGSNTITTLISFSGPNGANPVTGLITDAGGNLYGATVLGGQYNRGTLFKLTPVPEPSTLALAAFGMLGLLIALQRRRHVSH